MDDSRATYLDAMKMLARRELSEAQVRERLVRRGHDSRAIDEAVERLKAERAIDDARVAEAIARRGAAIKQHGKLRVQRQIEEAGVAAGTAQRALDEVFLGLDEETRIEAALAKRLRGRASIADAAEFGRLYRFLIGQGFEPDRVVKALEAKRRPAVEAG